MKRFSWYISKYILQAVVPYFAFTWLLLSVILFVQQASRYSEIFFNNNIPSNLIWQLTGALIPSVIAFTCPMAVLVGVIIGLSKMQGDSELIAIRAAGIGNLQISLPIIFLGILLSLFAFLINLKGVPIAAQIVRKVAIQTAIYKLESPIEPGVFNTELQGYTIYVKDGDIEKGTWKNIFIYSEDKRNGQVRLITSNDGRIDSNETDTELVLNKASINTFSVDDLNKNLVFENLKDLRLAIKTKRGELVEKLGKTEDSPEELGLQELSKYAQSKTGKEKTEAEILLQRRLLLSIAPLLFALLGTSLVLRFNRAGRGWGIFLALVSLIAFYFLALMGEQLARTGKISGLISSLLPIILTSIATFWFFLSQRLFLTKTISNLFSGFNFNLPFKSFKFSRRSSLINLTTGIMDFDIIASLLKYFLLTFGFLTTIYMIFTAFELWKFAGSIDNGLNLLLKYLLYLIPFIYIEISPSALMIATLATFVIKSRQNEVVTWTASGQSIYRLLFPCFIFMLVIGFINWGIQEKIVFHTNKIQDNLRNQIRNKGIASSNTGKNWVATNNGIYSFELDTDKQNISDTRVIKNLNVYQFDKNEPKLRSVIKVGEASWEEGRIKFSGKANKIDWIDGISHKVELSASDNEIKEDYNPFKLIYKKPNHLTTNELSEYVKTTESDGEKRSYSIALEKRYAIPFLPIIITLFTAPFALSLSRKGNVVTVGYAVGIWLLFMGITSAFDQFGTSGLIKPVFAVWSPLVLFTAFGFYLLSRVRT
jgi:LPS export ABC transporter permease LptF/LPS export ABC transporter permease LptG